MANTMDATTLLLTLLAAWLAKELITALYNLTFHPLANFPGPRLAASTSWYKTFYEVLLARTWTSHLATLHTNHGPILRVGPNDLHFASPVAYHAIYHPTSRWAKEATLYRSFGEDHSSFGFLNYSEAKARRDVLAPLFSRRATGELQGLVRGHVERLCVALEREHARGGGPSDLLFALRCFTLDTILDYCFAKDVHATEAPAFQAPMVAAMDASLPSTVVFRHFEWLRKMVFSFPGWLTKLTSPVLAGLVELQKLLGAQVNDVVRNPGALKDAPHPIIYHRLQDPVMNESAGGVPDATSLYEEAQALLFGGADSAANTTMTGLAHLLTHPSLLQPLKTELLTAWPDLSQPPPTLEQLEHLPYLTAVIKESLRVSPGVCSPLPRVVPASGATIDGTFIPAGATVSMAASSLHSNPALFPSPQTFSPDRWVGPGGKKRERYLVPFSRGPRACLGQSLAMCELYFAFAWVVRRFDVELEAGVKWEEEVRGWRECFLPYYTGKHLRGYCRPARM